MKIGKIIARKSIFNMSFLKERNKAFRPVRLTFWGIVLGMLITAAIILIQTATELPELADIISPESPESSQLMSADGQLIHAFYYKENRITISLDDISPHVMDALVAIEDIRFYQHSGIDPWTIPGLIRYGLTGGNLRGGSTISMQLARNLFNEIRQDAVWKRKIKEYMLAVLLERNFTKEEILNLYLSTVSFGENIYGIHLAAQRYFSKLASELSIEEAATLAGMLKATTKYNPRMHPAACVERRNLVIYQLHKYNFIKHINTRDSLQKIPLAVNYQRRNHISGMAPHFREYVRKWVKDWGEENGVRLYDEGLNIYTTIDSRMQRLAERAVDERIREVQDNFDYFQFGVERSSTPIEKLVKLAPWKEFWHHHDDVVQDLKQRFANALGSNLISPQIENVLQTPREMLIHTLEGAVEANISPLDSMKHYATLVETGFVALDPQTGYIKAWVGGSDFQYSKYDHVVQSHRQPGSAFKPFVYARAIEVGYKPCNQLLNELNTFIGPDGVEWTPRNADETYGGMMTLKQALAISSNVIASQLIHQVLPAGVVEFAHRMGIKSNLNDSPTLALGTSEVNLLELTSAYGTLANGGVAISPLFMTRIAENDGDVLYESDRKSTEVLAPKDAYTMINMLEAVVEHGTASSLRTSFGLSTPMAAKTGTSQENADGWFVGMIPGLVVGVWVGWDDRRIHFEKDDYRYGGGQPNSFANCRELFSTTFP